MQIPRNTFKRTLSARESTRGLWVCLADPVAAEIAAGAGFDWITIDAEHAANTPRTVLAQLQATDAYETSVIVRPVSGETAIIKQYLDVGAQTILAPMVDTPEQAADLVRAVRYPPAGNRGVATARGGRWGRVEDFWERVAEEICLVVQIESLIGVSNIEGIAAVDGVDGMFVGPADLGAAMGFLGQADHPEVHEAVASAIRRIVAAGQPAGVLVSTAALAETYETAGATFIGLGLDTLLLAQATSALARRP